MSVIHPQAPPFPFHRGRAGSRMRRQWLLGVFGLVLVIVVGAAASAIVSVAPAPPRPACPDGPCGKPPRPPSNTPPLVAGTVFTSPDLGYRVEFSPKLWSVVRQSGTDLELQVNSSRATVIVTMEGQAATDHSADALRAMVDRRIGELGAETVVLNPDSDPRDAILGPSVGYLRGVGQILSGVTDTPQGPSSAVVAVVMAAGDGTANVVVSVVTDKAVKKQAFEVVDSLMNTFRFPSEIAASS
ncbi:MAG: hypothetical protein M3Q23_10515 [Actinomycetota bacterium]|nr:hypothetical protein [Actinomycetota bacterium]